MKNLLTFDDFLNEGKLNEALKDISLTGDEANEIFDKIKNYVRNRSSLDQYYQANIDSDAGDFGKEPDSSKFKIHNISATTFDILVSITTTDNKVVCYVTMSYDTLKKSFKNKTYISFISTKDPAKFGQKVRQYKKSIYFNKQK